MAHLLVVLAFVAVALVYGWALRDRDRNVP